MTLDCYRKQYTYDTAGWTAPDRTTIISDLPPTDSDYEIIGLEGDSKYAVRVIAVNDVGETEGETSTDLQTDITSESNYSTISHESSVYQVSNLRHVGIDLTKSFQCVNAEISSLS